MITKARKESDERMLEGKRKYILPHLRKSEDAWKWRGRLGGNLLKGNDDMEKKKTERKRIK